jgi:serine/threonine protein kinase/tetratricopeptide (TPR) repeat protein
LSGLQLFHAAAAVGVDDLHGLSGQRVPPSLQTIGDYQLVREIGRGGMGVVYEAWQVSLRRRVALKVLPFTSANDAKQIGRFKNEAQAAAQVQHPNIVPVHAVGEENGVHYYVMQLIEGQSLTSLLGALRAGDEPSGGTTAPNNTLTFVNRADGNRITPRSSASDRSADKSQPMRSSETADHIRVVARLGIQAAEALHAAHEYGVVHRDVKPSNLLLDDHGKLWITDFGLARCREDQGLTQTGDVLGTMRYMSPEQALGRKALVDQRTDIYSLGLTMYELATLNHPADEVSDAVLLFDRSRQNIKPLRHWNRHIPADFQTIVLKCLAEFPHERYSTARELAEDLERCLDGRPILASPPSLVTRAGKWARRHRGLVYATAAVLLVALIGAGATSVMLAQRNAVNEAAYLASRDHLRETLDFTSRSTTQYANQLAAIPGAEGVREEILQDGIEVYQRFERQVTEMPAFAIDAANAQVKLGSLSELLGNHDQAFAAYLKGVAQLEKLVERDPSTENRRNLAIALNAFALFQSDTSTNDSLSMLRRARTIQNELLAADPQSKELVTELATTHSNLGLLLARSGASTDAIAELRQAIAMQEPLSPSPESDDVACRMLAASYNNLAPLVEVVDKKSADESYRKSIRLQRELVRTYPINRTYREDLARTYNNLGSFLSRNKDWKNAQLSFADALRLREDLVKASPQAASYRADLAVSYNNLGMAQTRAQRFADAESSFRRAIELQAALLARQPKEATLLSNQGGTWNNLATVLDQQQRYVDAADAYKKAIEHQRAALAAAPNTESHRAALSRHYFNYAKNLAAQGKFNDALQAAIQRKNLWKGNSEKLYSVAQELAATYRMMEISSADPQTKSAFTAAAVSTIREALAAGLPQGKLRDPSLASMRASAEFHQLLDGTTIGAIAPVGAKSTQ